MTDYAGVTDARHETTAGGAPDSVTFTEDLDAVCIANRSSEDPLYYTVGGTGGDDPAIPTVEGDDCFLALPGERLVVNPQVGTATRVRVISTNPVDYSIERG